MALDRPTRPSGSPGAGTSAGGMPGGAAGATAAAATAADSRPGLLLSIPAAVLHEARWGWEGVPIALGSACRRVRTCARAGPAPFTQVAGGRQKLLAEGPLAVLVVEASPPAAPATPTAPSEALPPGQLYPQLYKGPSASAASVASSEGSEGSAGGGSSSVAAAEGTSIMLAVGDVSLEVLPASQTLKASKDRGRGGERQLGSPAGTTRPATQREPLFAASCPAPHFPTGAGPPPARSHAGC